MVVRRTHKAGRGLHGGREIGGYLPIEVADGRGERYRDAHAFQSARAAFLALLLAARPRRVWIPWYICESMTDSARLAPVEVLRYGLNEDFTVGDDVEPANDDLLLYVNYFGLCDDAVDATIRRFGAANVVIDNSHAYFSSPRVCAGTLYSPRKFVGVPDGGYLVTSLPVAVPVKEDAGSLWRCLPLLTRLGGSANSGYSEYLASQKALDGQMPMRMSLLTRRLLAGIDYDAVAQRRRANYAVLESALAGHGEFPQRRPRAAVPMSYPLLGGDPEIRRNLLDHLVYVPQYWPHLVRGGRRIPAFERHLARHCIPLPCDQGMSADDLANTIALVGGTPTSRRRKARL